MIVTNLLSNMVLVSGLNIIQTNTQAFQEYAYNAMTTNSQALAIAWKLDVNTVASNNITRVKASPTIPGASGFVDFDKRYHERV